MPYFTNRGIVPLPSAATYAGPGDTAPGALFWLGLRAYSAAKAAALTKAVTLRDTTASTDIDLFLQADGSLNLTPLAGITGNTFKIATLYDQTGNGHNFSMTGTSRPNFTLSGLGSLPVMTFEGVSILTGLVNSAGIAGGVSTPYSISWAALNSFASGVQSVMFTDNANFNVGYNVSNTANNISLYNGATNPSVTASDASYHSIHLLMHSTSSSSIIQVDATPTTVNPGSSAALGSTEIAIGCFTSSGIPSGYWFDGKLLEIGVWASDVSTNFTAVAAQQHTYWGY